MPKKKKVNADKILQEALKTGGYPDYMTKGSGVWKVVKEAMELYYKNKVEELKP